MINWTLKTIDLPLKFTWKISRGGFSSKQNYVVCVQNQGFYGYGEVAFTSRNNESAESIKSGFDKFIDASPLDLGSVEELIDFLDEMELPNSLRFGIESAFIHYLSSLSGRSVFELLGLQSLNAIKTSMSIPIMDPAQIKSFIEQYNLQRFCAVKIKVNAENARDLIGEVSKHYSGMIRVDANEAFQSPDDVLKLCREIKDFPIQFLEQPMPSSCYEEYVFLRDKSPFELIADESITDQNVNSFYKERFHGINVKLMKAGGYLKAIAQLRMAKELGLKTMLGCMIETSLGISSAFYLASGVDYIDLDSHLFLKQDPFNLVVEENGKLLFSSLQ